MQILPRSRRVGLTSFQQPSASTYQRIIQSMCQQTFFICCLWHQASTEKPQSTSLSRLVSSVRFINFPRKGMTGLESQGGGQGLTLTKLEMVQAAILLSWCSLSLQQTRTMVRSMLDLIRVYLKVFSYAEMLPMLQIANSTSCQHQLLLMISIMTSTSPLSARTMQKRLPRLVMLVSSHMASQPSCLQIL